MEFIYWALPALHQGYADNWHMGPWTWGWGMMIGMLIFWVIVIIGLVLLVRWIVNISKGQPKEASALNILKSRYARGEISKEEFEEKKRDLLE